MLSGGPSCSDMALRPHGDQQPSTTANAPLEPGGFGLWVVCHHLLDISQYTASCHWNFTLGGMTRTRLLSAVNVSDVREFVVGVL